MKPAARRPVPATWLLSACVLTAGAAQAAPVRLASSWDLKELSRDFPRGVEAFKRADAVAAAGRPEEALTLFEQASKLAPQSPAPLRRMCEILTDLGRRDDALRACRQTLDHGDAPEDYRALIGALMAGTSPPMTEDFVLALVTGAGIEHRYPHDPMGHAALFDIARRLGDRGLMKLQLREMERLAPNHYETRRAQEIVAASGPGPLHLLGWSALLALCGLTLARAVARLLTHRRSLARVAAMMAMASVLAGGAAHAQQPQAGQLSTFGVDDDDPEASLPPRSEFQKNPVQYGYLVMDLADKAEAAIGRKDYPRALKYYGALAKIAPDRAIGFGKMCEVHELAGDRDSALGACRRALLTEGARSDDYERFVRLIFASSAPLTEAEQTALHTVIAHLRRSPAGAISAAEVECKLAVRMGDAKVLERCTAELARLAPSRTNTLGFEWALATLKSDRGEARRVLDRAKQAGVTLAGMERMELATRRAQLTSWVSYGVAAALVLAAAGLLLRRRRAPPVALASRSPS